MANPVQLTPAAEKLLRALARADKGDGVHVRYLSRGRYHWGSSSAAYNRASFYPLFEAALLSGWDGEDDPVRVTDTGRQLLTDLDAAAKPKREKKPPNPESPAAIRALRAIAALPQPVRPYSGTRRGLWALGSRGGHGTTELLIYAMEKAGYVRINHGAHLSTSIEITDTGRTRAAA
ncbi:MULTISPECIES: hypothetical protein [unclassified Streptomyces]|uniref:hypothetical protein n=1 Tax=unclassified Streptomyces TaxID=2593676 RepID=UPI00224DA174|nr:MULTISPECIES: hypothetical protein [unclassified Streptomyces]MCX4863497.1 hypothetical protein [Streptomyces sp. NBC_00906]MCX4894735.1 hypothetical protein [Streptomyces sp. NBC_00892]